MADNINISPDMIDNLINMLKNSNSTGQDDNSSNTTINNNDFSKNTNSNSDELNNFSNIDFNTILKIKSIMENLNTSNNQDSKLLYSLKPYLRKSRQAKIDQYINILKITQLSKFFNKKGDEV